jgi:hypothetical protein
MNTYHSYLNNMTLDKVVILHCNSPIILQNGKIKFKMLKKILLYTMLQNQTVQKAASQCCMKQTLRWQVQTGNDGEIL